MTVGLTAMVAPALHALTDVMEWWTGGFSATGLWINLVAFLPMPVLLLGICASLDRRPAWLCHWGALLYGASFLYFIDSTLYALARHIPDYASLWQQLGTPYTLDGALMVAGGILFALGALQGAALPRAAIRLFLIGILANLVLAIVPAPDILQTVGSGLRNAGLILMGHYLFRRAHRQEH